MHPTANEHLSTLSALMVEGGAVTVDTRLVRPRERQVAIVGAAAVVPRHHSSLADQLPTLKAPRKGRLDVYSSSHKPAASFADSQGEALRFMLARRPGRAFRVADVPSAQRLKIATELVKAGVLAVVGEGDDGAGALEMSWARNMRRAAGGAGGAGAGGSAGPSLYSFDVRELKFDFAGAVDGEGEL
jgi:hypothetical protein